MTHNDPVDQPLRVSIPDGILTLIPYLAGYHPANRIAAVLADAHTVQTVACSELGEPQLLPRLLDCARRHHLSTVFLAIYSPLDGAADLLRTLGEALRAEGLTLLAQVQVNRGHRRVIYAEQGGCGPWQPIEHDTVIAAQMVAHGRVALADRDELIARFAPTTGTARDTIRLITAELDRFWAQQRERDAEAAHDSLRAVGLRYLDRIDEHVQDPSQHLDFDDRDVAQLGISLRDVAVRDGAAERVGRDGVSYQQVWIEIMRRVDHADRPAPATIAALASWRCGDAMSAGLAVGQALDADPTYRLARLLQAALAANLPAPSWSELTGSTTELDQH